MDAKIFSWDAFCDNVPAEKAQFAGRKVYKDIIGFQSPSSTFLKVELLTKSPEIGKNAVFTVTGSKISGEVTVSYCILSKYLVALTGKVTVDQGSVIQTFDVPITSNMAPAARILVYVKSDGEIVADGLSFTVQEIFQNKVGIQFNKIRSQPGENVEVQLKADPDSVICVLAVDKSVLLLQTGNDITEKRLRDDLGSYGGDGVPFATGSGIPPSWAIPADDAHDVFNEAGLIVSTDGNLHKFDIWSLNNRSMYRFLSGAAVSRMINTNVNEKLVVTTQRVIKFFPETMIFTNVTADANGRAKLTQIVPDTITVWVANAFALNVKSGLGIAPMTANLTVFQNFFVSLQLLYSVVQGEDVVIQANVFNYYGTHEYVLVTLTRSDDFDRITIDEIGKEKVVTGDLVQCVQGGSAESRRSLGAYIFIALKEIQAQIISKDESHLLSLNEAIATAEKALANSAAELATEYEMAIIANALSLTEKYAANDRSILNTLVQSQMSSMKE